MRTPVIVGNWKMNKTIAEAVAFINEVDSKLEGLTPVYGVGTSFLALQDSVKAAKNLVIAAENCHFEESGAFTGEVSIPMLKEIGVKWVIIGHSERRQMFGETDEAINKKAKKLLANGMVPIICVGETLDEFEAGRTEEVVRRQVHACVEGLSEADMEIAVIAYEPVWAIGTGKNATKEIAQDTCAIVRDEVAKTISTKAAETVRIQYGGSVKPENIKEYMAMEDIDGALVGGAALKSDSFLGLVENTK